VARIFVTDAQASVEEAFWAVKDGDKTVIEHNPEIWDI
jgi:hypothetical protein